MKLYTEGYFKILSMIFLKRHCNFPGSVISLYCGTGICWCLGNTVIVWLDESSAHGKSTPMVTGKNADCLNPFYGSFWAALGGSVWIAYPELYNLGCNSSSAPLAGKPSMRGAAPQPVSSAAPGTCSQPFQRFPSYRWENPNHDATVRFTLSK